jgi:hypothetical protein
MVWPALQSAWRHMAAPDPFPGEGGSGPLKPVGVVRPVGVWPPHVVAPDLPGESGSVEAAPEHPALVGTWKHRTYKSTGEVRRPRSQLSGLGHAPRHPKNEGEVMDNLTPVWMDTLSLDSLTG